MTPTLWVYSSSLFVDLAKFDMMKSKLAYYQKIEEDSMQPDVSGFICDVNYCVISDV